MKNPETMTFLKPHKVSDFPFNQMRAAPSENVLLGMMRVLID